MQREDEAREEQHGRDIPLGHTNAAAVRTVRAHQNPSGAAGIATHALSVVPGVQHHFAEADAEGCYCRTGPLLASADRA